MALENMYNVPEVCSGMLRIAPRALQILNFLGGGPPNPPSYLHPQRLGRISATVPPDPPWGKNLDPPLTSCVSSLCPYTCRTRMTYAYYKYNIILCIHVHILPVDVHIINIYHAD